MSLTRADAGAELTTKEWHDVLRQANDLGVLQVGLSGGEPLVRRDLEEIVASAAQLGLYTSLITAGTMLTRRRAEGLHDAGLDHVQLSIQDSHADAGDWIAGTVAHARKVAAAHLIKEHAFPLTINVVLHRYNLDRLADIIALSVELGADRLELANAQYQGWAVLNQRALLPTPDQLASAERVIEDARSQHGSRLPILYVLSDLFEEFPKPCMGGWGQTTLVVAPDGTLLPCHGASDIPDLRLPSVRQTSIQHAWFESPSFNRFRGTDWMEPPCSTCPLHRQLVDFGGCRCQALRLAGRSSATDPVCRFSPHHNRVIDARRSNPTAPPITYRTSATRRTTTVRNHTAGSQEPTEAAASVAVDQLRARTKGTSPDK